MFTESADIYDLVYSFKDYKKEAEEIKELIRSKKPEARSILDIGCGTAEHHIHLKDIFSIDGIDINDKFVSIASRKNPFGSYSIDDMASFDLHKKYDIIMCLFSSIGYLKTVDQIISALKCFNDHLNPGGLLLLEPWFTPENYTGKIGMSTYEKNDLKICRMAHGYADGIYSILNFHYLIATPDKGVRHLDERHELRMTSTEEMMSALNQAGFIARFDNTGLIGRGMYYGTKKNL